MMKGGWDILRDQPLVGMSRLDVEIRLISVRVSAEPGDVLTIGGSIM